MKYGIKSKTNLITNSSSEVFCYKIDSDDYTELKELIPELKDLAIEFKTWEDLKEYVTKDGYYWEFEEAQNKYGEENNITPRYDFYGWEYSDLLDSLKKLGKTDEEIWEFFKVGYLNLLGYAYWSFYNDDGYPEWTKRFEDWRRYRKETKTLLEKLKPYCGKVIILETDYCIRGGIKSFYTKISEDGEPGKIVALQEKKLIAETEKDINLYLRHLNFDRIQEATKEEIEEYEKF